jgi:hypothetical protein
LLSTRSWAARAHKRAELVVSVTLSNRTREQSSRDLPANEAPAPEPAIRRYFRRQRALIAIGLALLAWAVVLAGAALVMFLLNHKGS